ncbi:hypothetical protein DL766_003673 [Monosporascus sp. MC13-8B]|uniref:NAD(P)H-hydrate epimerase n=1 Tax=Monosporascus cannonballus TaxID=155416 RepID=A0ABY0H4D8_9PEZI|nr:hypothetical protein DL762_005988 [Monosporascus cannonballus]RYO93646.1 hypothetical protein DL763_004321 [Monosporascus cannonballus]RYP33080.1 hypothetical protein DL766_003673 [Monosporascus sp. MC13-8B]
MRSIKPRHLRRHPIPRYLSTNASAQTQVTPITSLLIANRGEIALRINRTANRLGIQTTTLYTDPDATAQHAACSLRAIGLGAANGYLDGERIVRLAKQHGIQALHPGYGFLSENAAFARRCEQEGIVFVGPPAQAMADMGDKARSKEIMTKAGVPCVPGYHGSEQGETELLVHAKEVGFPVLLKSVKGGGGKGMRIVMEEGEFLQQLKSARAEARASFGEGGEVMLVEKYIVRPRHVEVQVFADKLGNCVALGERDCSVQRRHQKILEESPAPDLGEATRLDLWEKARTAALAVGYVGAGTVEFILDKDSGNFYFMEMNTRLQVEHPVSEMVTGTDLVEWQFRVAAGEKLPLTQEEIMERIKERGAAIEARIYAENPERGFIPDSGKLVHLTTPKTDEDIRIDAGFVEGDTVTEAYDGMIAKLIVRGKDRETAIRKMELALRDYEVVGLSTNIEFLKRLCRSQAFVEGDVETGFIEKWKEELFDPVLTKPQVYVQAALGMAASQLQGTLDGPHGESLGFGDITSERKFVFKSLDALDAQEGSVVEVSVVQKGQRLFDARVVRSGEGPQVFENLVSTPASGPGKTDLVTFFPETRIETTVVQDPNNDNKISVFQHGAKTELTLVDPTWYEKALGLKEVAASVVAPMPCKVLKNEVREGDEVVKGTPLVVIESMKMETVIRSPQNGVIKRLAHKEGDKYGIRRLRADTDPVLRPYRVQLNILVKAPRVVVRVWLRDRVMDSRDCGGLEEDPTTQLRWTLSAAAATALDKELMSTGAFSIDQLMELAGLSVSQVVYKVHPPDKSSRILVACGPGNNGGDGLVAARHLRHYGYQPTIFYPKRSKNDLYQRLSKQLEDLDIPFVEDFSKAVKSTDHIIDAIFGFSFSGEVREPFPAVIEALQDAKVPVTSVDVPSSWNIETGPPESGVGSKFNPDFLVSLTAPKPLVKYFKGRHFIGGRFVSPAIAKKYDFEIPEYQGLDQFVEVGSGAQKL